MCVDMCVLGGGGVNVMQLCICTVFQKCEVYCMHLMSFLYCLYLTVILTTHFLVLSRTVAWQRVGSTT